MGQSRMDYPEKLATLGTQDTGQRQTKQKTHHRKLKRRATRTAPKTQQRKLKRRATWTAPKTQHRKLKRRATWTAQKTQHRKLKRRATWTAPKTRVVPNCSQRENITLTLLWY